MARRNSENLAYAQNGPEVTQFKRKYYVQLAIHFGAGEILCKIRENNIGPVSYI